VRDIEKPANMDARGFFFFSDRATGIRRGERAEDADLGAA
jgi:hypothetical protein